MRTSNFQKTSIHSLSYWSILCKKTFALLFAVVLMFGFSSCAKKIDYMDYVSELRSNIFLASAEDFRLRIYAVEKETPYKTDGIPHERATRTEVFLSAPSGDKICNVTFCIDDKTYGGEMSFDVVKAEYYYSCTLNITAEKSILCVIEYGEKRLEMTATSVCDSETLTPNTILKKLQTAEKVTFENMTDQYGFQGEIYLRLIYEDSPYYYVGIITRDGSVTAFLINAKNGKVLAKHQS